MKRYIKQIVALLLAMVMVITMIDTSSVYAEEVQENGLNVTEKGVNVSTEVEEESQEFKIDYVITDNANNLETDSQSIVVGYSGEKPSSARIKLQKTDSDEIIELESVEISDTGILFQTNEIVSEYTLKEISVETQRGSLKINLADIGIQSEEPDAYIEPDDQNVNGLEYDTYSDNMARSVNGNYVIVLDPGHDATHAGTRANGVLEENANLKIATYCKQELETYYGVNVLLTRSSTACPYPGTSSTDDNANRVAFAKNSGADAYVSFHCNSSDNASANGTEVYYPNSNYNSAISSSGADLAQKILNNLSSLGLKDRGIKIRTSDDGDTYPDGSLTDYYGVIRRSKLAGIPAVIIEHAFVTNASDAANYLGNETNLQKMGIADATGIAQHFGLSKQGFAIKELSCIQENNAVTVSASCYSDPGNVRYKFQVYDVEAGQWYTLADNTSNASVQWKPYAKSYWVHVEATSPNGVTVQQTNSYESDIDYNNPYVKLNGICTSETQQGINVGVNYLSNDSNVAFKWLAYDVNKKVWSEIADWNGGNWATWRPQQGTYWIQVQATCSNGKVESQTIAYNVQKNYSVDMMKITGTCWQIRENGIDIGAAYEKRGNNPAFKWQIYNLDTKKWMLLSDWNGGNWTTWRPQQGNYWVNVQAKTDGGASDEYTFCFRVDKDYSKTPITISGLTWKINRNSIDVGAAYQTADKNTVFKWMAYNLDTKQWELISDWYNGNWATWKPQAGNYWLHVEAKNNDGGYAEKTICFSVDRDYSRHYIDLNGICLLDNHANFSVGVAYDTDDKNVKFKWQEYNINTKQWRIISDWTGGNWTEWDPANGSYWVYVQAKTSDGIVADSVLGYNVSARYEIMGQSSTNIQQMVNYYNSNAQYPTFYGGSDAPSIQKFCSIYDEECKAEGVKTEVAFCQAMKETNFLRYGGDVNIAQYNFAGIGATGNGTCGSSYSSVREGIRAQVQHLKAYGSNAPLNQQCVDNRFAYVKRNSAKYVEWLGSKENPNGTGWATATNYGYSIIKDYVVILLQK